MTKEPNLKEIERKAYMSYHRDGLLDIFVAIYILGFSLGIFMNTFWDFSFGLIMPGILVVLVLPLWIAAKRKITIPRIGYVNFGTRGANKLTAVYVGLMVAGLGFFFVFGAASSQAGLRGVLDLIIQNGMLAMGLGILVICSLFGYIMGLKRLYAYGILAGVTFTIGHFIDIFFVYITIALGVTILATGCSLLVNFIRNYPLKR